MWKPYRGIQFVVECRGGVAQGILRTALPLLAVYLEAREYFTHAYSKEVERRETERVEVKSLFYNFQTRSRLLNRYGITPGVCVCCAGSSANNIHSHQTVVNLHVPVYFSSLICTFGGPRRLPRLTHMESVSIPCTGSDGYQGGGERGREDGG